MYTHSGGGNSWNIWTGVHKSRAQVRCGAHNKRTQNLVWEILGILVQGFTNPGLKFALGHITSVHTFWWGKFLEYLYRGSQIPGPNSLWRLNFVWIHITELPSCHPSGVNEFEPAPRLLEKLITSVLDDFKDRKICPTIS